MINSLMGKTRKTPCMGRFYFYIILVDKMIFMYNNLTK